MHKLKRNEFLARYRQENLKEMRYRGIQEILVDHIRGSVNRWQDFDEHFQSKDADQEKLRSILRAFESGVSFPPIQVYQVKEDYYVIDGNHRVSVAKEIQQMYIDAEVFELLPSGDSLDHLLWRKKAAFNLKTGLNLNFTDMESYRLASNYLLLYQQELQEKSGLKISLKEAARDWWTEVYEPGISLLRQLHIEECFPGHSLDDLFLYILHHQYTKSILQGRKIRFQEALSAFVSTQPDQMAPFMNKLFRGFVFKKKCTRLCGQCAHKCPEGLICLENGQLKIDAECSGCGRCTDGCPERNLVAYEKIKGSPRLTVEKSSIG
ncbi:MAG TPA: hypothetical protein DDW50_13405 [Firmicutes bacterium]|jgi:ferredoxin|nr:hypothetical protein [Bacillota bacterium]